MKVHVFIEHGAPPSHQNGPVKIWITYQDEHDGYMVAAPVALEFKKTQPYETRDPTLEIPIQMADGFLDALVGAVNKLTMGRQASTVQVTLEATQDHLKDLQAMLGLGYRAPALERHVTVNTRHKENTE